MLNLKRHDEVRNLFHLVYGLSDMQLVCYSEIKRKGYLFVIF
jgi:hypothetical protein